jgi:hypothetical protein
VNRKRMNIVYWRDVVVVRSSLITFMEISILCFRV